MKNDSVNIQIIFMSVILSFIILVYGLGWITIVTNKEIGNKMLTTDFGSQNVNNTLFLKTPYMFGTTFPGDAGDGYMYVKNLTPGKYNLIIKTYRPGDYMGSKLEYHLIHTTVTNKFGDFTQETIQHCDILGESNQNIDLQTEFKIRSCDEGMCEPRLVLHGVFIGNKEDVPQIILSKIGDN